MSVAAVSVSYRDRPRRHQQLGDARLSVAPLRLHPALRSPTRSGRESGAADTDCSTNSTFFVHNHLHTVHAIASCNAAEMAMGMLMEATVPTTHRWIPKAMSVEYLLKATTSLRATARIRPPDFSSIVDGTEVVVPVSVTDRDGRKVVHTDITTWVTRAG